jgi:FlaA1/EpsC-like NDP-sugar epimerase
VLSFRGKRILVTGGTGSLGQVLVRRLLSGAAGKPAKVIVFSRDEAKQHEMRLGYMHRQSATDEAIYRSFHELLSFRIGDVRDLGSLASAVQDADVVFNAAALKQVPTCEYFPFEAVQTNILGAQNIVRAIRQTAAPVELVMGISTDKACKPINVMGMTKAIQERIFVEANLECPHTRFACVRYGNVIVSRGSVIPLFQEQIRRGGPVTLTLPEMTRFMLTVDHAVDAVIAAARTALAGETYIPILPSARIVDVARALMNGREVAVEFTGIRPGEKIHEVMISEEERFRTIERDGYYVIRPLLPELRDTALEPPIIEHEYTSAEAPVGFSELQEILAEYVGEAA